jgi:nucleoside-diphosphate-sugar epimerase
MKIFVTGATGVLGRPVVRELVEANHQVQALSRSAKDETLLRGLGAGPVEVDLFDISALTPVLSGVDAILHLATRIPPSSQMSKRSSWLENDHLRRDGTRCLVEAALSTASVQHFIYPSYAFVYPDSGMNWIDAGTTTVQPNPVSQSTLEAEATVARFAEQGRHGVSLRLASLYGPEAGFTREQIDYACKGLAALPGSKDAYFPQLWVQDAASALITALNNSAPSGVYDVADDEPLTRDDLFHAMAQAVRRKHLLTLPGPLLRLFTGVVYEMMSRSLRVSNRRYKEISGWKPLVPSAREGWAQLGSQEKVTSHV